MSEDGGIEFDPVTKTGTGDARDSARLRLAFGIEPMRIRAAITAAVACAFIPAVWIASASIVVGVCMIWMLEQRQVAAGLGEVDVWGFPVAGYRAWILAVEPAFDLELRRDVGVELLEASAAAVDANIKVERRGERIFRVTMPRVELAANDKREGVIVGDRRMLRELADRVLAPLHADVGIDNMRMGDARSLATLVAAPRRAAASGDAFREQAIVAPPDLQSLVKVGTSQLLPPHEAKTMRFRIDHLIYATGGTPTSSKIMTMFVFSGTLLGLLGGPIGAVIGSALGSGAAVLLRRNDRARMQHVLASVQKYAIPIDGYDNWLLSGRPIFDVELRDVPEHPVDVVTKFQRHAHNSDVVWLDDKVIRVETTPIEHLTGPGLVPIWGGNAQELGGLIRQVIIPLHEKVGVVAVRMGGYLDRRA